tara:strand:+ start:152 stop:826 length:675 start_codon:yes stop_codon:yes gene_type:complete
MKIVALIPAKKTSIRLPNKNFLKINKKPIFDYTIKAAKKSKIFDKICISSDNYKFLNNFEDKQIEKIYRKKKLGNKKTSLVDVCKDFIFEFQKSYYEFDILCLLYPTAPLRLSKDIIKTYKLLNKKKCHFSLAATKYTMPPQQALILKKNKFVKPLFKNLVTKNESDIGKLVVDNGSTYFVFVKNFLSQSTFYGNNLRVNVMKKTSSIDLNDKEDLKLLKKIIK